MPQGATHNLCSRPLSGNNTREKIRCGRRHRMASMARLSGSPIGARSLQSETISDMGFSSSLCGRPSRRPASSSGVSDLDYRQAAGTQMPCAGLTGSTFSPRFGIEVSLAATYRVPNRLPADGAVTSLIPSLRLNVPASRAVCTTRPAHFGDLLVVHSEAHPDIAQEIIQLGCPVRDPHECEVGMARETFAPMRRTLPSPRWKVRRA